MYYFLLVRLHSVITPSVFSLSGPDRLKTDRHRGPQEGSVEIQERRVDGTGEGPTPLEIDEDATDDAPVHAEPVDTGCITVVVRLLVTSVQGVTKTGEGPGTGLQTVVVRHSLEDFGLTLTSRSSTRCHQVSTLCSGTTFVDPESSTRVPTRRNLLSSAYFSSSGTSRNVFLRPWSTRRDGS